MDSIFLNFESAKLNINNPGLTNLLLFILFFSIIVLTTKKKVKDSNIFLSCSQSEQLKGIAIFFVILGHLWVHVSESRPSIVLSGDAVSMFLILSGFGMTKSSNGKILDLKNFVKKRINRIMIPYWIATIFIIIFDSMLLGKVLNINSFIMTFLGINLSVDLRHLDYVRWFVTFILLWYIVFYISNNYLTISRRTFLFISFPLLLLPLSYYILHFGWYQFFSFPIGCILAIHYQKFVDLWNDNRKLIIICSLTAIIYALLYHKVMSIDDFNNLIRNSIPNLFLAYFVEANSIVFNLGIIFIFTYYSGKGFESKFLLFLGRYSYELFLLHGVLLIKYNLFFQSFIKVPIEIKFSVLFMFITILSITLAKLSGVVYAIKKQ
jgi:membrane-bound acyltransferase YfiQ involved in biofilm formation